MHVCVTASIRLDSHGRWIIKNLQLINHGEKYDSSDHQAASQRWNARSFFHYHPGSTRSSVYLTLQVRVEQLSKGCHYIPYHYVKKETLTTPIRIVYNCSNKGWDGVSLSGCMETGAPLHNDQVQLLIRFWVHVIGLVANVKKAFEHIKLYESDRDYLRWMGLSDP